MKYTKTRDVKTPTGRRGADAGMDLYIPNDWNDGKTMKLYVGQQVNIPTGIKVEIPEGYMVKIDNKSGTSVKKGLVIGATIIDASYRGEMHCNMQKASIGTEDKLCEERPEISSSTNMRIYKRDWSYTELVPGEKIAQAIIIPISNETWDEISNEEYNALPETVRGEGGFGSTTVTHD